MRHTAWRRTVVTTLTAAAVAIGGALVAAPAAQAATITTPDGGIPGVDVSGATNWANAPTNAQFAYISAVTGSGSGSATQIFANQSFYSNWAGATQAGLPRGAYALAVPSSSAPSAASQATYFYDNGGALATASPYSLPPVIDLELDSNGTCRGASVAFTQDFISSYVTTFKKLSGVTPVIYTTKSYWSDCVGASTMLSGYPLWIADPNSPSSPALGFGGWSNYELWQYAQDQGGFDYDSFHGSLAQLRALGTPRIAGPDRYGTSLAAALSFQPGTSGVSTVFVADALNYPDALAAGAAAGKAHGPVVLVPPTGALPAAVTQTLTYLRPQHIVVVGGTGAVSAATANALTSYSPDVTRASGADRYGTSAALAADFPAGVENAYVAMGTDWPDALSGSALAASAQGAGPMLLLTTTSIPAAVGAELSALRPQHIYVLGGTGVVNNVVQAALVKYTASGSGSAVSRLSGADRYATSVAVAQHLDSINGTASGPLYAASGTNFPDALVGAPVAALTSQPLLLVPPAAALPSEVQSEAQSLAAPSLAILGGTGAVSPAVQSTLNGLVG